MMDQVEELREKFLKKYEEEGSPDPRGFHPNDLSRIQKDDHWLKRFLDHHESNLEEALKMLWETCTWRRKFQVNEMNEDNVRRDYLEDGVCFSHGKDKDGKILFIIKSKLHVKGERDFEEVKRCIVYWFERLEREGNGDQMSIFFDMADTGLSNLDLDFMSYLIGLFKSYYPNFLNHIIVFEMPWILSAGFRIIKAGLPKKAISKIRFVNKQTLKEYVDSENALECWGGLDDYVFHFVPEVSSSSGTTNNAKVHFAEDCNNETLLLIEPNVITFTKEGSETIGTISLKNTSQNKVLSYKIKTTSPEKFRVRPSSGILASGEDRSITVTLQQGYNLVRGPLGNDRFLVMCLPLKNNQVTPDELINIWKTNKPTEEHRLRCTDTTRLKDGSLLKDQTGFDCNDKNFIDNFYSMMNRFEEMHKGMHKEIMVLRYLFYTLVILAGFVTILFGWIIYNSQGYLNDNANDVDCPMNYNQDL